MQTSTSANRTWPRRRKEAGKSLPAVRFRQRGGPSHRATGLYAIVYDNINMNFASAEQIIGRHDTQENGTCATLFTLNGQASVRDLDAKVLRRSFLDAPELSIDDILLTEQEQVDLSKNLVATTLRIIVEFGGDEFAKFKDNMEAFQPTTSEKVKPQKTKLFPLPAWNIDESSITGNVEVNNAIVEELELEKDPSFGDRVRILAGDQLTIARLRSIENMRAGNEHGYEGFFWGVHILGLFHTKIADMHGLLLTHFGKPDTGTAAPGSLWFHNTCLDRLPITLTSLPPFRTCRDLVFVSLYARVLHCLLLVSKCDSLSDYMEKFGTWDALVSHAQEIYEGYARGEKVQEMRWARKVEMERGAEVPAKGDMVFENAVLFMRDALISREFHDAIKSNDPGRIIPILKVFALSFRGTKRLKYAYEMLFVIHQIKHIWPGGIRRIVFNNMVMNPSGLPESGVEDDLVQEHMNLLIKVKYKARGSNNNWDWMYTVTPCVNALRELQGNINKHLGHDMGTKHANAQLGADIRCLMDSLKDHQVYVPKLGRVIKYEDAQVPDVVDVGLSQLSSLLPTSPLAEYNAAFKRLQKRRQMTPVTKPPSPVLNATELPAFGARIFPETPSPPSSPGSTRSPASNPIAAPTTTSPAPVPESERYTPDSPTSQELLDEIAEVRDDMDPGEPLLEGELRQLMDDVEHGVEEETLPRESLRDVALDMDAVDTDEDMGSASDDSGSDSDFAAGARAISLSPRTVGREPSDIHVARALGVVDSVDGLVWFSSRSQSDEAIAADRGLKLVRTFNHFPHLAVLKEGDMVLIYTTSQGRNPLDGPILCKDGLDPPSSD
ncbi:hypothetical protein NMY22_g7845 [Coprinellus aureogranulatus]|nr:hypothetical protein NMY22_g7845 [Coprinellus aureogranulatus]